MFGAVGTAKSSTVKALVKRGRAVYPERFTAIIDPKGEYTPLAVALGLPVVKLHPGGLHRLNPMEAGLGNDADRGRAGPPRAGHPAGRRGARPGPVAGRRGRVGLVRGQLSRRGGVFTLDDLARELQSPGAELLRMARLTPLEMGRALSAGDACVGQAVARTLRGMFDAATNVAIDWQHGPGVVLDLSAVYGNTRGVAVGDAGRLLLAGRRAATTAGTSVVAGDR